MVVSDWRGHILGASAGAHLEKERKEKGRERKRDGLVSEKTMTYITFDQFNLY